MHGQLEIGQFAQGVAQGSGSVGFHVDFEQADKALGEVRHAALFPIAAIVGDDASKVLDQAGLVATAEGKDQRRVAHADYSTTYEVGGQAKLRLIGRCARLPKPENEDRRNAVDDGTMPRGIGSARSMLL